VWALKDGDRYSKAQVDTQVNAAVAAATGPLEAKNADLASQIRDLEGKKADLEKRNRVAARYLSDEWSRYNENNRSARGSPVGSFRPVDSMCGSWAGVESRLREVDWVERRLREEDWRQERRLLGNLEDSVQHHLSLIYLDRTPAQAEIRYRDCRGLFLRLQALFLDGQAELDPMALRIELLERLLSQGSRPFFLDASFQAHLVPPEELARLLADMYAQRSFEERTCLRDFGGYEHWVPRDLPRGR
jgi:hypothetical protein